MRFRRPFQRRRILGFHPRIVEWSSRRGPQGRGERSLDSNKEWDRPGVMCTHALVNGMIPGASRAFCRPARRSRLISPGGEVSGECQLRASTTEVEMVG